MNGSLASAEIVESDKDPFRYNGNMHDRDLDGFMAAQLGPFVPKVSPKVKSRVLPDNGEE